MIITVDGLDGVGKSTLAKKLAKELNYKYIDKPIYELFHVSGDDNYLYDQIYHLQDLVYNQTDSNALKSWFTGMSLLYIKEVLSNENIIIDRGLLSCYAFNGDKTSNVIFETLINLGVWFDLSIVLYASTEERLKRMKQRNENDPDLKLSKITSLKYNKIMNFLANHDLPNIVINTDNKEPEEILSIVLNEIKTNEKIKKRKKEN